MWRNSWDVVLEGVPYTLGGKSFWHGSHQVERNGYVVAVSGTAGAFSTRVTLDAAPDVPLDHQLFLLWMVLILRRRSSNAAVGASVAGGAAASSG